MGIRSLRTASISTGVKRSKVWDQSAVVLTTAYESIATVNVGAGGTSSITFSSIPSTYKHLQIRAYSPSGAYLDLRLNGDTNTANYYGHVIYGTGSGTPSKSQAVSAAYFPWAGGWSQPWSGVMDILDYSNTSKNKVLRTLEGNDANGSGEVYFTSHVWMSTAAISSITLSRTGVTMAQNTRFALYGIKG